MFCATIPAVLLLLLTATTAPRGAAQVVETLSATPSSASFGTVTVGTKNSQAIQLKNVGRSTIVISSATVTGTGFSISGIGASTSIGPQAAVNLTVNFAPLASGSVSGHVTIASNATDRSLTISLSGTGGTASRSLSLSTSSLSFGTETLGMSLTKSATLTNTGTASVTVSGVSISGNGFALLPGIGGVTIAAGQKAEVSVVFDPLATGTASGQVSISSNAANSPAKISLSGSGASASSTVVSHSVSLSWDASTSSGITGYNVYRSTVSGSAYSKVNTQTTSGTRFTDDGVTGGDTYYYVVTAVNSSGEESPHSNQVTVVVP